MPGPARRSPGRGTTRGLKPWRTGRCRRSRAHRAAAAPPRSPPPHDVTRLRATSARPRPSTPTGTHHPWTVPRLGAGRGPRPAWPRRRSAGPDARQARTGGGEAMTRTPDDRAARRGALLRTAPGRRPRPGERAGAAVPVRRAVAPRLAARVRRRPSACPPPRPLRAPPRSPVPRPPRPRRPRQGRGQSRRARAGRPQHHAQQPGSRRPPGCRHRPRPPRTCPHQPGPCGEGPGQPGGDLKTRDPSAGACHTGSGPTRPRPG